MVTSIVAGSWGGRRLAVPRSGTRPTSQRVREAVMDSLQHRFGTWDDLRVLDVFAGSGALGFEALSRGAPWATFVDNSAGAGSALRANARTLSADNCEILSLDAAALASRRNPGDAYRLVFADPPYDSAITVVRDVVAGLIDHGWCADGAVLVVETARRSNGNPWPGCVRSDGFRDYGDTRVWYGLARASNSESHGEQE